MAAAAETGSAVDDEELSPRQKAAPTDQDIPTLDGLNNGLESLDLRADPDAQATVTDFLDFTEYLPSDMVRSLTLIGQLDQSYIDASTRVHDLATAWGQLPAVAPEERRSNPVQLRADISENLNFAVSSRVYSHAEAVRMAENVNRHYNRLKTIHSKLKTLLDNYPAAEEQKSPVMTAKSPQMTRSTKITLRLPGGGDQKARRPRVPRITVPGEVLAPYELEYETYSDDSDSSEEEEDDDDDILRRTPAPRGGAQHQRIKLKTPKSSHQKTPKSRSYVPVPRAPGVPIMSSAQALSQLQPPPENAVIGSDDAPWMRLTAYELAVLRKRMKKNSAWTPSETMIARELKNLGRGWEAFSAAKQQAEAEGKPFEAVLPAAVVDDASGAAIPPLGAVTVDAAMAAEDPSRINRGSELNKAKKLKREQLGRLAAMEAEESARKMREAAVMFLQQGQTPVNRGQPEQTPAKSSSKSNQKKRKRNSVSEVDAEKPDTADGPALRPQPKRTKTETPVPVPVPQFGAGSGSNHLQESHSSQQQLTPGSTAGAPHPTTPVPVPIPGSQEHSIVAATNPSVSPASATSATVTTTIPTKPPADNHIQPPVASPRKSTTPILPPVRETRWREAKKEPAKENIAPPIKQSSSRAATPARLTPGPESARRPGSRGKAASQEPQLQSLATDRPRRASTARNTPAPEARQPSKRVKRPAPGVISRTNSGGNSAVGKRKAPPKKKARQRRDKGQSAEVEVEVEVDDEGNTIDPDEPRYCLCNRVSFGTMIQCDNDNCKQEWFHLECVGLSEIPARTTKWYCPDCRVALNIGEKGEVSARGVRA